MILSQTFSLVLRILLPLPYELIHAYFSLQILHNKTIKNIVPASVRTKYTDYLSIKMSIHGNLRGKSWSLWKEALGSASPTGSDSRGSTRSDSPAPDDVMKLTREDMNMFGRCPAWDTFLLVICDKCRNSVKIEAFESHLTLRHGTKSERNAYHKVMAAKAAESLKTCHVKLTPVKSSQEMRQSPDLNDIVSENEHF